MIALYLASRVHGLRWAVLIATFAAASYVPSAFAADPRPGAGFYDVAQLDDPSIGRCDWLGRERPFVFQESDYIRGYFEPANLAAYRQAIPAPFTMPERPMIRISGTCSA
jgi:hypothetical protein